MIYKNIPKNFNPRFEVVSCYVEHDGEILLLHRHDHKSEGGRWGVPAGKIDEGEKEIEAMLREMKEETGYEFTSGNLKYITKVYVRYPEYDFVYHMFRTEVGEKQEVVLSKTEHRAHTWVSPVEALTLELVKDLDKCIEMCYLPKA
ncbi:MAG: NUDIX hydrolase [Candidatus Paceibacterota bacterium]